MAQTVNKRFANSLMSVISTLFETTGELDELIGVGLVGFFLLLFAVGISEDFISSNWFLRESSS